MHFSAQVMLLFADDSAAVPVTLATDTFTRADGTTGLGTTTDGKTWQYLQSSVWGIRSNRAYCVSDVQDDTAYVDVGTTNYTASVDLTGDFMSPYHYPTLAFYIKDANNLWYARIADGEARIIKKDTGTATTMASFTTGSQVNGQFYNLKVALSNGSISFYVDNTLLCSYSLTAGELTTWNTTTTVGLKNHVAGVGVTNADYDNFLVTT
jgi:hypothetical protein